VPPVLYLGKAFLGRKFVEYGDGILGPMFANCAKFCNLLSRQTWSEAFYYLLKPSYRGRIVNGGRMGLKEGFEIE
jgi:hypothetical protein